MNQTGAGITVTYTIGGSATSGGTDYTTLSGSVVVADGNQTAVIDVLGIIDDGLVEADETVIVTLSGTSHGSVGFDTNSATVTIVDSDSATVSIANVNDAAETGAVAGKFRVTQTAVSSTDTVLSYSVLVSSTATNGGTDYTTLTGTVTISAGDTTADIDVTGIVNDAIVEADETVVVKLGSVTSGDSDITIDTGNDTATVTIVDNDAAVVTVADVTVNEGAGTATITVNLDNDLDQDLTIDVSFGGDGSDFANTTQERHLDHRSNRRQDLHRGDHRRLTGRSDDRGLQYRLGGQRAHAAEWSRRDEH